MKVFTSAAWAKTTTKTTAKKTPRKSLSLSSTFSKTRSQLTCPSSPALTLKILQKCCSLSWVFCTRESLARSTITESEEILSNKPWNLHSHPPEICNRLKNSADRLSEEFHRRSSFQVTCPLLNLQVKICLSTAYLSKHRIVTILLLDNELWLLKRSPPCVLLAVLVWARHLQIEELKSAIVLPEFQTKINCQSSLKIRKPLQTHTFRRPEKQTAKFLIRLNSSHLHKLISHHLSTLQSLQKWLYLVLHCSDQDKGKSLSQEFQFSLLKTSHDLRHSSQHYLKILLLCLIVSARKNQKRMPWSKLSVTFVTLKTSSNSIGRLYKARSFSATKRGIWISAKLCIVSQTSS